MSMGEKGVSFVEVNFVGGFIQLYIIAISSKGKIDYEEFNK